MMNDKNQTDNELTILRTRNSVEIEIDPDTVLSCPFEDTENIPEERAYNKSAPHNNEADIDDELYWTVFDDEPAMFSLDTAGDVALDMDILNDM